jgi:hypothetical protein
MPINVRQMECCIEGGMERQMFLARYFLVVGGVLLALLFVADAYLPRSPVADTANANLPVIRIHTDRKWPARVVYDTSLPTIVPAQTANTVASVEGPATVADAPVKARLREVFAQMQPSDAQQLQQPESRKREAKLKRKQKITRRRVGPPIVLVARHPQFGWFGHSIW